MAIQHASWDLEGLMEVVGDDTELIASLTELFVDDSRQRVSTLEAAMASHDLDCIGKEAHTIKGASANIRAEQTRQVAARLEQAARHGEGSNCAQLLNELKAELERLYAIFTERLCPAAA